MSNSKPRKEIEGPIKDAGLDMDTFLRKYTHIPIREPNRFIGVFRKWVKEVIKKMNSTNTISFCKRCFSVVFKQDKSNHDWDN